MYRIGAKRRPRRRGYTVLVVLAFILILLSMLGVAFRRTASVLRVSAARSNWILHDEGCMRAAAQAVATLENGPPPTDPYTISPIEIDTSAGTRSYQATISSDPDVSGQWVVSVEPSTFP